MKETLFWPRGEEFVDQGQGGDVLDCGGDDIGLAGGAGDEEVEVADGLAASAEGAGRGDGLDAGEGADEGGDALGVVVGLVDAEAAGVFAVVLDAFEELGGELFAHAGELAEMPGFGGGFEGVDVGDLEGGPDEGDGLGAHAGEAQEFEHGGLVFGEKLGAEGHGAGGDQLDDIGGHAFADAGDGEELFGFGDEGGELGGLLLDGLGGAAVGADAEGVGCVDLKQGGGFVEQAGDGDVVHEGVEPGLFDFVCDDSLRPAAQSVCNGRWMRMHVDTGGPGEDID